MKNSKSIIIVAFSLIFLYACYQDLDLERYRTTPKVVLNSAISSDTIVMASVSQTIFFTDTENADVSINNADVDLYVNGSFKEKMTWSENSELINKGIYTSGYVPVPGDLIKIMATTSLGSVWAEDFIPIKVEIQNIALSYRKFKDPSSIIVKPGGDTTEAEKYEIKYQITFQDDPGLKNYYCIRIENTHQNQPLGFIDYSLDPVFLAQQSIMDASLADKSIEGQGGRTFSDELINGEKYTLVITETEQSFNYEWGEFLNRKVILYSLSESYYHYLTSLLNVDENKLSNKLTEFGFSEPIPFYNNINGGVGIFATVQSDINIIDLRTILPDYWE